MPRRLALALALLLAVPTCAQAIPRKLPPVDQCKSTPGLGGFRDRLKQIVAKRDGKAFRVMLAPDVLVNFGGEAGPKAFADTWHLNRGNSELWPLLTQMLKLGCAGSGSSFVIPSLTDQLNPESADDIFDQMLALPGAKLRKGFEPGSDTIAMLAWDLVTSIDRKGDDQTKVRLADGREGWLFDNELYAAMSYRMVIEKRRGKWMITALVAGD